MNDGAEADAPAVHAATQLGSDAPGVRSGRNRLRRILLAIIALLYLVSVPWYRDADAPLQIVFGLPDWVAVAVGCYVGVAILNAIAWMLTDISDTSDPVEDSGDNSANSAEDHAYNAAVSSSRGAS